jgi:GTPase SAR1 family protein
MPNAKDAELSPWERLLVVGRTGSGKTAQIWTLPGRKFAYIFDVNALPSLKGLDMDYETFHPDVLEMDATLKGFNKDSTSDKMKGSKREPTVYMRWVDDLNERVDKKLFDAYDWLIIDSLSFFSKAVMDRQMYINKRYGDIEDLGDYRVVGSKIADVFGSVSSLPINIYCTGHVNVFQDDKTKKIETELNLPGKARRILPTVFTNVWLSHYENDKYLIRTKPENRGLQDIRTSLPGLKPDEDVTIPSFDGNADRHGIGALLRRSNRGLPATR